MMMQRLTTTDLGVRGNEDDCLDECAPALTSSDVGKGLTSGAPQVNFPHNHTSQDPTANEHVTIKTVSC